MRTFPLHALAQGVDPVLSVGTDVGASLGGVTTAGVVAVGALAWAVLCAVVAYASYRLRVEGLKRQAAVAVAHERSRLARELHDVVGHGLLVITMHARQPAACVDPEARRLLRSIEEAAQRTLGEMRRIVGILRRRETDDEEEPRALSSLIAATIAELPWTAQAVRFEVVGAERPLAEETRTVALRVVQEGLNNAFKHGSDGPIKVCVQFGASLSVSVTTGRGPTAPESPPPSGSGYGLAGLRERVTAHGGRFACEALPGGEFRIRAQLPLATPDPPHRPPPSGQRRLTALTGAAVGGAGRADRDEAWWGPLRTRGLSLIGTRGRERR